MTKSGGKGAAPGQPAAAEQNPARKDIAAAGARLPAGIPPGRLRAAVNLYTDSLTDTSNAGRRKNTAAVGARLTAGFPRGGCAFSTTLDPVIEAIL